MVQIYPERESRQLEFKSRLPKFDKLNETCIALANGSGGMIIIGIKDDTREIIGIDDKTRNKIYDEFPNSLYDATSPSLLAKIYEKNYNGKSIIIIQVAPSSKKPCFIKSKGIPEGVFVRVGSSTRKANDHTLEDLYRENKRINFDEELIEEDIDILSKANIKNYYNKQVQPERMLKDKFIGQVSINSPYRPTVAGLLLFANQPEEHIDEALIRCTRFKGKKGRDIIQTEELTGTLEEQIHTSFELLQAWLKRDYKLFKTKLKAKTIIPEEALREAIVNAVLHRKYSIPGSIKIALYDDHLEIFNPGSFPGLIDPKNLGDGTTFLRNPHIARAFRKIGLIESLGSGIRLIFDSCKKASLSTPQYYEDGDFVKVRFDFNKVKKDNKDDLTSIIELLKEHKESTAHEIAQYLSVSRNTATRKLNRLIEDRKIIRVGHTRNTKFKLAD